MARGHYLRNIMLGAACSYAVPVNAAYIYDFQGAVGSEWSTTAASGIHTTSDLNAYYAGTRLFLGEYGNDTLTLSLDGLAAHTAATVSFSLYLIRSWDGNDVTEMDGDPLGPDRWSLSLGGGPTLLDTTFSNGNRVGGQDYDGAFSTLTYTPWTPCNAYADYVGPANAPMTGANECYSLGYTFGSADVPTQVMDSIYELSFTFLHTDSSLVLNFAASGLQGLEDESWGLDNVRVDFTPVPVPAAVWLFGSGLLGLVGAARRKRC